MVRMLNRFYLFLLLGFITTVLTFIFAAEAGAPCFFKSTGELYNSPLLWILDAPKGLISISTTHRGLPFQTGTSCILSDSQRLFNATKVLMLNFIFWFALSLGFAYLANKVFWRKSKADKKDNEPSYEGLWQWSALNKLISLFSAVIVFLIVIAVFILFLMKDYTCRLDIIYNDISVSKLFFYFALGNFLTLLIVTLIIKPKPNQYAGKNLLTTGIIFLMLAIVNIFLWNFCLLVL